MAQDRGDVVLGIFGDHTGLAIVGIGFEQAGGVGVYGGEYPDRTIVGSKAKDAAEGLFGAPGQEGLPGRGSVLSQAYLRTGVGAHGLRDADLERMILFPAYYVSGVLGIEGDFPTDEIDPMDIGKAGIADVEADKDLIGKVGMYRNDLGDR